MKRLLFDPKSLEQLCRRHRIARLSLFGSVLRGTENDDSDVDLLVEFDPGQSPGLIGLAGIEQDLSTLLDGRRVDLRTLEDLSPHFRSEVARTAEEQFAA